MNYPTQRNFTSGSMPAARSKIAVALVAMGAIGLSLPAQAALQNGSLLTIVRPAVNDPTPANAAVQPAAGSWFSMLATDTNDDLIADSNLYTKLGGFNGLRVGTIQTGSGSHVGSPNGTETLNIDTAWIFFTNTGLHYTSVATNVLSASGATATLDFSGWHVHWNGVSIPMTGGAWELGYVNGVANVTCDSTCADGENYTLDYSATVPQNSGTSFGGVQYRLHLTGRIVIAPVAVNDSSVTTVGIPVNINVLANDAAAAGINPASVIVVSSTTQGGTAVAATTGVVTYTPPGAGFSGVDTFTYTYSDLASPARGSNAGTVTVTVNINSAPTAVNDVASVTAGTSAEINVLANDTDLDGNINPASVVVTVPPLSGSVSVNSATGVITYTAGSAGSYSFTYTVRDTLNLTSNPATVTVTVGAFTGDWTIPIAAGDVPILFIESGSYFTMELSAGNPVRVNLSGGADSGLVLGAQQFAGGSHTGAPTGNEVTGIDQPWSFFSNTGMHYTNNGGIGVNTDGTLNFNNRWFVTWNSLPAINMGGSAQDDQAIRGRASIACTPAPCANGSAYVVNYSAHVPLGDPSGFGGVPYGLRLVGYVRFVDKTLLATGGAIGPGSLGLVDMRVSAAQLAPDTAVGTACVGDCFDFQITGVSGRAQVVLPLIFGIRPNSTYRKYMNGTWRNFDTSTLTGGAADTLKSAPFTPGTATCPAVGNSAYTPGLIVGNHCVQLDIADNGPNDANPASGTFADPSGVAAAAVVTPPDNRTTGSSGCSLSTTPVNPLERGDWWLLLGFVAWMGFVVRRKRAVMK